MRRRTFLKAAGVGVAAAGIEGILTAQRAPVFAQANTVHILRWNDFVPAADKVLREVYAPEVQKALGIKLNVETINANDIPARATSSIQSGNGPDIIMLLNNYPHLYASRGGGRERGGRRGRQGGRRDLRRRRRSSTGSAGKWVSMPWSMVPALIAYRKSWFDEVGAKTFPKTWEEYHEVGKKLKAAKHPIGQTLGNTFGDAPTFTYPFLWSFGGQEVDAKGKVVLDSKETVESVRFMAQFWKDAHDEGGLAWDDSNNNRAFLSGDISASLNGASIYVAALNGADKFKTEKGAPLHTDILHAPLPAGPEGRARLPHRVQPHGDEVLEERQGRDRVPALGAQEGELREVVHRAEGLRGRPDARVGEPRDVEERSGDGAVPTAPLAQKRLMGFTRASPTRRPPRPGTSSSSP